VIGKVQRLAWNIRDLFQLPALLRALEKRITTRVYEVEAGVHRALAADQARPVLATLTVLCERHEHGEKWVPTFMGEEVWLAPGEHHCIQILPQVQVRNFRWYISGGPDVVVEGVTIGNEYMGAAFGAGKCGDIERVCNLGTRIGFSVARRKEGVR
jgi:hypothetical protein